MLKDWRVKKNCRIKTKLQITHTLAIRMVSLGDFSKVNAGINAERTALISSIAN